MSISSFFSRVRRSFDNADTSFLGLNSNPNAEVPRAETVGIDRPLNEQEHAIAKWLLTNAADPSAVDFLSQLDMARVSGHCSCGCPTVDLRVSKDAAKVEALDNPIGDAIGEVNGKIVGVMLLQSDGYLRCLEIYDLSDIEHPYGLPELSSLKPFDVKPSSPVTD